MRRHWKSRAEKILDSGLTPARRTNELRANDESFFDFALRMSKVHQSYFRELYPPNPARLAELREEAARFARGTARGRGARRDAVRRVRGALCCRIAGLRRGAAT